jgi:hypothetical protein
MVPPDVLKDTAFRRKIHGGPAVEVVHFQVKTLTFLLLALCLFAPPLRAQSLFYINASSLTNTINGALLQPNNAGPGNFGQELLSLANATVLSSGFQFTSVPFYSVGGQNYFEWVYDSQETGSNRSVTLSSIKLYAGSSSTWTGTESLIWSLDGGGDSTILLNDSAPYTASALNPGGDLRLLVPMTYFSGFSSSDYFYLEATQSNQDNGPDEWYVLNSSGGGSFLPPSSVIPEPSSALLATLAMTLQLRRRRSARGSLEAIR